jgi:hypothetical protein
VTGILWTGRNKRNDIQRKLRVRPGKSMFCAAQDRTP